MRDLYDDCKFDKRCWMKLINGRLRRKVDSFEKVDCEVKTKSVIQGIDSNEVMGNESDKKTCEIIQKTNARG